MKAVGGREGDNNFNVQRGMGRGWGVGKQLVYLHSQPLLGFRTYFPRSMAQPWNRNRQVYDHE